MKKKVLSVLLILMLASMCVFANGAKEDKALIDIGYSVPDTTNPFLGWLTGAVKERAEAEGIAVQIADAGNSSVKQVEQIENFIAMNVKVLCLMPIDPNNVQNVIKQAQAKGIKVLVAGTDTGVYDVMLNMNQYNCGEQISEMAIDWLLKTFSADAAKPSFAKKPKVIVIKSTETLDMTNRSNGLIDKITNWGYAEVVVATKEAHSAEGAFAIMENMWQQNNDAVAVLCYNADGALGVNEFLMGQPGLDKAKMGVFAGDWSTPIQEILDLSPQNKSVFRGTMQIVGPKLNNQQVDLDLATFTLLKDLLEGNLTYGSIIEDSIKKAYAAQ